MSCWLLSEGLYTVGPAGTCLLSSTLGCMSTSPSPATCPPLVLYRSKHRRPLNNNACGYKPLPQSHHTGLCAGEYLWPWTLKIDTATRPFLKYDLRYGDPPSRGPYLLKRSQDALPDLVSILNLHDVDPTDKLLDTQPERTTGHVTVCK